MRGYNPAATKNPFNSVSPKQLGQVRRAGTGQRNSDIRDQPDLGCLLIYCTGKTKNPRQNRRSDKVYFFFIPGLLTFGKEREN
jgi:hypothetical protein